MYIYINKFYNFNFIFIIPYLTIWRVNIKIYMNERCENEENKKLKLLILISWRKRQKCAILKWTNTCNSAAFLLFFYFIEYNMSHSVVLLYYRLIHSILVIILWLYTNYNATLTSGRDNDIHIASFPVINDFWFGLFTHTSDIYYLSNESAYIHSLRVIHIPLQLQARPVSGYTLCNTLHIWFTYNCYRMIFNDSVSHYPAWSLPNSST